MGDSQVDVFLASRIASLDVAVLLRDGHRRSCGWTQITEYGARPASVSAMMRAAGGGGLRQVAGLEVVGRDVETGTMPPLSSRTMASGQVVAVCAPVALHLITASGGLYTIR